jgi:hypothetical protein
MTIGQLLKIIQDGLSSKVITKRSKVLFDLESEISFDADQKTWFPGVVTGFDVDQAFIDDGCPDEKIPATLRLSCPTEDLKDFYEGSLLVDE